MTGFTVEISGSGHSFECGSDQNVIDAALQHGVMLPYSCRGGSCGSCQARILSGSIHYPDGLPLGINPAHAARNEALLCLAQPRSDLVVSAREVRSSAEILPRVLPARVAKFERLCHDVMAVWLQLPASQRLQYLPGQYVDVLLQDGGRRSFSIANSPAFGDLLELHIRHVPGGRYTEHVFSKLREKELLRIEGPLGSFFLREDSPRPILLVTGGTGFAPMKAIIEHAFELECTRPIHLFWGVRSREDLYLADEVERWVESQTTFSFTPVLSEPKPEERWNGASGFVHQTVAEQYPDLNAYDVYMSGPPPMIQAGRQQFFEQGLSADHCYFDSFDFYHESKSR